MSLDLVSLCVGAALVLGETVVAGYIVDKREKAEAARLAQKRVQELVRGPGVVPTPAEVVRRL